VSIPKDFLYFGLGLGTHEFRLERIKTTEVRAASFLGASQ
jgi:hypothetical protein